MKKIPRQAKRFRGGVRHEPVTLVAFLLGEPAPRGARK